MPESSAPKPAPAATNPASSIAGLTAAAAAPRPRPKRAAPATRTVRSPWRATAGAYPSVAAMAPTEEVLKTRPMVAGPVANACIHSAMAGPKAPSSSPITT